MRSRKLTKKMLLEKLISFSVFTPAGCQEWIGGRTTAGYGVVRINRKPVYVHRKMYELAKGPIAKGMCVCHSCDNPPCCRIDHLFLGSQADNIRDSSKKGRMHPGEQHGMAKTTASVAVAIFWDFHFEGQTRKALVAKYKTTPSIVNFIVIGRTWRRETEHLAVLLKREKSSG